MPTPFKKMFMKKIESALEVPPKKGCVTVAKVATRVGPGRLYRTFRDLEIVLGVVVSIENSAIHAYLDDSLSERLSDVVERLFVDHDKEWTECVQLPDSQSTYCRLVKRERRGTQPAPYTYTVSWKASAYSVKETTELLADLRRLTAAVLEDVVQ